MTSTFDTRERTSDTKLKSNKLKVNYKISYVKFRYYYVDILKDNLLLL